MYAFRQIKGQFKQGMCALCTTRKGHWALALGRTPLPRATARQRQSGPRLRSAPAQPLPQSCPERGHPSPEPGVKPSEFAVPPAAFPSRNFHTASRLMGPGSHPAV